jgi:hypothetical protein
MSEVDVPGFREDFGYNDTPVKAIASVIAQHSGLGNHTTAKFQLDSIPNYLNAEIGRINEYDWSELAEAENESPNVDIEVHSALGEGGIAKAVITISDVWVLCYHADGSPADVKFKVSMSIPETVLTEGAGPHLSYKWEAERMSTEPRK